MKRILALIAFATVASQGYAAEVWTSGNQTVANIIWITGARGFYAASATFHDPQGCGGAANHLYLFDPALDDKTVDRLYAMLLSAGAMNKTVYVRVDGCVGQAPKIMGLQINY